MPDDGPFHEGERRVQELAGEQEMARRNGGMIARTLPSRAAAFLAEQWMLAVGAADARQGVRADALFGDPGFVTSPDGRSVVLTRAPIDPVAGDALWSHLAVGTQVGLLAIDLSTRRRLRINGTVTGHDARRIEIGVAEAYPNCPKYVQRRALRDGASSPPDDPPSVLHGESIDTRRAHIIARADTVFVASRHAERGVDVSHRGGAPGFIRMLSAQRLRMPDYPGNGMFNTFGNFAEDDRAALAVLDFERGRLLQLTGTAELYFDAAEDPRQPTGGTGRYWEFQIAAWRELPIPRRFALGPPEYSPYIPASSTG